MGSIVGSVEISAIQGVAPAAPSWMLTFEIGFADSLGGAISALAVYKGHHGGPSAGIRARKIVALRDIRESSRKLLLRRAGAFHSKSASQTRAAKQCRLGPAFKGTSLVPAHQSVPKKREPFSKCPRIKAEAPAAPSRMLTFEIGFADSQGGAILAIANFQGHHGGPSAGIRARKGCGSARYQQIKASILLHRAGAFHSKSASHTTSFNAFSRRQVLCFGNRAIAQVSRAHQVYKFGESPANLIKSTKVFMATPQGRRLGTSHPSTSRTQNLWILDSAY